jgi:hypothetical protein
MEGIFVPVGNDLGEAGKVSTLADPLADYFARPPSERPSNSDESITAADADAIDSVLARAGWLAGVRVDRQRLAGSYEAWVHVTIDETVAASTIMLGGLLEGFEPFPTRAVLVWPNSD